MSSICLIVENDLVRSLLRLVVSEILYNTTGENFTPILSRILDFLDGRYQQLAVDLLLLCCTIKDGSRIPNWTTVSTRVSEVLQLSGTTSKELCLLASTIVAKSDTMTSKSLTTNVFQVIAKDSKAIGIFCQLVGRLNETVFKSIVLEEFVKYINHADEDVFDEISTTVLALKQQGLLVPATTVGDNGNGRLNSFAVSKKSKFIQKLQKQIISLSIKSNDGENLLLWRDLQVLEVLGVWTPEVGRNLQQFLQTLLLQSRDIDRTLVGSALSVLASNDGPQTFQEIADLVLPKINILRGDVGFLEGFEKFLMKHTR